MSADGSWEKKTDSELVAMFTSGYGEASGEMMRRLKNSTECLARVNIILTCVLIVVAILQLFHH